jgi:hypothetical protein
VRLHAALVAVFLLALALALPAGSAAPGPRTVALAHVAKRLHLRGVNSVVVLRSRINKRWTLVDGYYRKPRLGSWALWLRLSSGRWRVVYGGADRKGTAPAGKVPCDIWPAFTDPACTP